MSAEQSNIRAAVDKVVESTDMSVRPIVKDDDGPADKQVLIRTTDSQRDYWKRAADEGKMTLSSWIRETLDNAARSVLECEHPMALTRVYPWATICTKCGKRLRG
jgi:hypothetical protein